MRFKIRIDLTDRDREIYCSRSYDRLFFFTNYEDRTHRDKLKKVKGDRFNSPNVRHDGCNRGCSHRSGWKVF